VANGVDNVCVITRDLQLPADLDDQREMVDEIVTAFVWACARKTQERRLARRRFAV
jgi:hypothetical protein